MSSNPEQRADEIFVGNLSSAVGVPSHLSALSTCRLGKQAYDLDGKRLPAEYAPMFVGRAEAGAYDSIMDARLSAVRTGGAA